MINTTKDSLGGVIAVGMEVELVELPVGYFKNMTATQAAAVKVDVGYTFQVINISGSGLVTLNIRINEIENPAFDYIGRYRDDIIVPGRSLKRVHSITEIYLGESQSLEGNRVVKDVDGNLITGNSQVYLLDLPADYLYDYPEELDDNLLALYYAQVGNLHKVECVTEWSMVEVDFRHSEVIDPEDGCRSICSNNIVLPGRYFRVKPE